MTVVVPDPVARRLDDGEVVQWRGQPRQGFLLRGQDAFLVPFSLLWAGIPTAAFVGAAVSGSFTPGLLFLLVFVAVGQYVTWGRFVIDRIVRGGLFYVVTDRRALIVSTRFRSVTRSYGRGGDFELIDHRNGRGTIRFLTGSVFTARRNPWGDWYSSFEQIDDADHVFRLVRAVDPGDVAEPLAERHRRRPPSTGSFG